jgi:signal transduction histidine kinase
VLALVGGSGEARQTWGYVPVLAAIPVSALVGWANRGWRSVAFGLGAAVVAAAAGGVPEVWPGVAALVFVSVLEDRDERPLVGWVTGVIGSTAALVIGPEGNVAPFLAVGLGGSAALLLRSWTRNRALAGETRELRGQAAWLEERTSVARELHDVVGHHVTAMVVQAEAGQLGDPRAALRTIGDVGRTALKELDALVVHLRDPHAPLTVSAPPRLRDVDELLAAPLRAAGVAVDVQLDDDLALEEADVLTVYRVVQEALTNVARHADAGHVWVEVGRRTDRLRVRVSDDGTGLPPERTRGSGLLGIEERVLPRGGEVVLDRRPGGGTILDVSLPVPGW